MGFADLVALGDRTVRGLLGSAFTYAPSVGDPVTVQGIFDASYVLVDVGDPGVSSVTPAAFVRRSELPSDPEADEGATLTVEGKVYRIRELRPDSQGGVLLLLNLV